MQTFQKIQHSAICRQNIKNKYSLGIFITKWWDFAFK